MIRMRRLMVLLIVAVGLLSPTAPASYASELMVNDFTCVDRLNGTLRCGGGATGGTGIYTSYTWMPAPSSGSGKAVIIACYAVGGDNEVSLTVIDSSGARATRSKSFYCYGG